MVPFWENPSTFSSSSVQGEQVIRDQGALAQDPEHRALV